MICELIFIIKIKGQRATHALIKQEVHSVSTIQHWYVLLRFLKCEGYIAPSLPLFSSQTWTWKHVALSGWGNVECNSSKMEKRKLKEELEYRGEA